MATKKARYYLYRNLHTDSFSIKRHGLVIQRPKICIMQDVIFKVSKKGQDRVRKEKRKNVHATVAGLSWISTQERSLNVLEEEYEEIFYDPYRTDTFVDSENTPIYRADKVLCQNNKIYIKNTKEIK